MSVRYYLTDRIGSCRQGQEIRIIDLSFEVFNLIFHFHLQFKNFQDSVFLKFLETELKKKKIENYFFTFLIMGQYLKGVVWENKFLKLLSNTMWSHHLPQRLSALARFHCPQLLNFQLILLILGKFDHDNGTTITLSPRSITKYHRNLGGTFLPTRLAFRGYLVYVKISNFLTDLRKYN